MHNHDYDRTVLNSVLLGDFDMVVIKFTEAKIRNLVLGSGIHRDETVKGLLVVCHKTTKTYAVQGDVRRNGRHIRTVRIKIDRVDRISLLEARRQARILMSTIQSGIDPSSQPEESGITLQQALEAHIAERSLSEWTLHDYHYKVEKYLGRFRKRAVADISRQDCRELLESLMRKSGTATAAGVLRTLRTIINTARRLDETLGPNPVDAVRIPIPSRRKVDEMDVGDFWIKTEGLTPIMRDLQRAILLSGARKTSMFKVRREDVDLSSRILTFTHQKTSDEPLLFPMGPALTDLLRKRLEEDIPLNNPWLWPSPTSAPGHIVEAKRKEIPSPHALRHHMRTTLVKIGCPMLESSLLIGHTLPGMAATYVHAQHLVENLRPWAEKLEQFILGQAGAEMLVSSGSEH